MTTFPILMYIFVCLNDRYVYNLELKVHKELASVSREYCEGGLEYYSKTVSRNKKIHDMMGDYGDKAYTAGGNERHLFFRTPHAQPSQLKHLMDDLLIRKYIAETDD